MAVWKSLNNEGFGLMNGMSEFMHTMESSRSFTFPDLTAAEKLYIFSDYGGEHKGADFFSYAFLITDENSVSMASYFYQQIKSIYRLGERTISYKKLNDVLRFRALYPFLKMTNAINGFVVVILIEKNVASIFKPDNFKEENDENTIDLSFWKRGDREKLLRVIHILSLFISGLSRPMQDICWITDQDNIVVTDNKLTKITEVFVNISSHYLSHTLRKFQCGRANIEVNGYFEMLCSLPDLAAGAISDLLTYYSENNIFPNDKVIVPASRNMKPKINNIVGWFMDNDSNLKKLCVCLSEGEEERIKITHLKFHNLYNSLGL